MTMQQLLFFLLEMGAEFKRGRCWSRVREYDYDDRPADFTLEKRWSLRFGGTDGEHTFYAASFISELSSEALLRNLDLVEQLSYIVTGNSDSYKLCIKIFSGSFRDIARSRWFGFEIVG
jgi:hypothetical protein